MSHRRTSLLLLPFLALSLRAADWPQWRGPNRDGASEEKGLLTAWPKAGPNLLWKATDLGLGYAAPAVVGERIYVLGNRAKTEYVFALDGLTGKEVWATSLGEVAPIRPPQYSGPRATPSVSGDQVYALGSDGDLVCLDKATGQMRWRKHLRKDFQGKPSPFAYSESPLVDGDQIICAPGGQTATVVALNKRSGQLIWKTALPTGDAAGYASPIVAEVGKVRQPVLPLHHVALAPAPLPRPVEKARHYVLFLQGGVVGVEAKTGKFLWRYTRISGKANIPTPIFHDGMVFCTGQPGGALLKLKAGLDGVSAEEAYLNNKIDTGSGGSVRVGRHVYGTSRGGMWCAELATGKVLWRSASVGVAALCAADGHLYARSERGPVALVEATSGGYKEKGRFLPPDRSRLAPLAHPVVANGRFYLRDQNYLFCYDVRARNAKQ